MNNYQNKIDKESNQSFKLFEGQTLNNFNNSMNKKQYYLEGSLNTENLLMQIENYKKMIDEIKNNDSIINPVETEIDLRLKELNLEYEKLNSDLLMLLQYLSSQDVF